MVNIYSYKNKKGESINIDIQKNIFNELIHECLQYLKISYKSFSFSVKKTTIILKIVLINKETKESINNISSQLSNYLEKLVKKTNIKIIIN